MKDHDKPDVANMAVDSYHHAVRKYAHKKGIVLPDRISNTNNIEEILTNLTIMPNVNQTIITEIMKGMEDIKFTKLDVNIIRLDNNGKMTFFTSVIKYVHCTNLISIDILL